MRARMEELMDREVIHKFDKREGKASDFYKLDDESPDDNVKEE